MSETSPASFEPMRDVETFHARFDLMYVGKPRHLPAELSGFREGFLREELNEYQAAARDAENAAMIGDEPSYVAALADQQDALCDLLYVLLGTAYLHGFNIREGWARVQAANMAKVRVASAADSKRGSAYDVVKPPGWMAPDHVDLVLDHEPLT